MAKSQKKHQPVSEKTVEEADLLASQVLRPADLKQHRKLVAQGIQQGIDLYKKKHKAKARELDKKLKKATSTDGASGQGGALEQVDDKPPALPWVLLVFSWLGFVVTGIVFYLGVIP